LLIAGLLFVYTASYDPSLRVYKNSWAILMRQVIFIVAGIGVAVFMNYFDYHRLKHVVVWLMGGTIAALILVLIIGTFQQGAVRTLIGASVQPSELAKLATVVYLAVWLFSKQERMHDIYIGLVPMGIMLGVLAGLIFKQPDISAVLTIVMIGVMMFFLAGGKLPQILLMLVVVGLAGLLVIQVSTTASQRIAEYERGWVDPLKGSTHVARSFAAFTNGGWVGVGIGQGKVKVTGLPVPHTDSIFAVAGEETGVLGATLLVGLYTIFLWRGLTIARRAPDLLGSLLAGGLTLWIAWEAFVNMAVMLNILPFAGNALPLISYGGSSMLTTMCAVGILLNISRLSVKNQDDNGRFFGTLVDLRWRDWRRSIPGVNRSRRAG
jgi:cell division protein FtsW